MQRGGHTYIITNKNNTTVYVGVTSNLYNRIYEHKTKKYPKSFSARYNLDKLVWYLAFPSIQEAIAHEKYLKGKGRNFKNDLINTMNPEWKDLWNEAL